MKDLTKYTKAERDRFANMDHIQFEGRRFIIKPQYEVYIEVKKNEFRQCEIHGQGRNYNDSNEVTLISFNAIYNGWVYNVKILPKTKEYTIDGHEADLIDIDLYTIDIIKD